MKIQFIVEEIDKDGDALLHRCDDLEINVMPASPKEKLEGGLDFVRVLIFNKGLELIFTAEEYIHLAQTLEATIGDVVHDEECEHGNVEIDVISVEDIEDSMDLETFNQLNPPEESSKGH